MKHQRSEMLAQSLKGMAAAMGAGSGITHKAVGVTTPPIKKRSELLTAGLRREVKMAGHGGIVTVASKVVSVVQGRDVQDASITEVVRSGATLETLVEVLKRHDSAADNRTALMLDQTTADDGWILPPLNPNEFCYAYSLEIFRATGTLMDVVVCDSGSGAQKGFEILGCETYLSTPIGATKGISLVHAQRCSSIAEIFGNRDHGTPYVVITPESWRSRNRIGIGEFRYPGYLDAEKESLDLPVFGGLISPFDE